MRVPLAMLSARAWARVLNEPSKTLVFHATSNKRRVWLEDIMTRKATRNQHSIPQVHQAVSSGRRTRMQTKAKRSHRSTQRSPHPLRNLLQALPPPRPTSATRPAQQRIRCPRVAAPAHLRRQRQLAEHRHAKLSRGRVEQVRRAEQVVSDVTRRAEEVRLVEEEAGDLAHEKE